MVESRPAKLLTDTRCWGIVVGLLTFAALRPA